MSLLLLVKLYFSGNLIPFDLLDFDIILGMKWLHTYRAMIDCRDPKVILSDVKDRELCFYGQREEKSCPLILVRKQVSYCIRVYWVLMSCH